MESVFGFISVLPGAFSAYRYEALVGAPLDQYFRQIDVDLRKLTPFKGNMYLAEDRILCFELLASKRQRWLLRYVKGAKAMTDVPETLTDLIKQRRRWLNGSLFAMIYALSHYGQFLHDSNHSLARKTMITIQFAFFALQLLLTWFLLANLFLMFRFSSNGVGMEADIFNGLFVLATMIQVVIGMGNKPDDMTLVYVLCTTTYGVFFSYTLVLNAQLLLTSTLDQRAALAAVGAMGVYLLSALIHGDLFPILGSIAQYFFMLPTFLVGFPIYSFCNVHDISWGTKGLEAVSKDLQVDQSDSLAKRDNKVNKLEMYKQTIEDADARFRSFRSQLVIGWLGSNILFILIVSMDFVGKFYICWVYYLFFGFNAFKFFFFLLYMASTYGRSCFRRSEHSSMSFEAQETMKSTRPMAHR
jgi:chitin synthase